MSSLSTPPEDVESWVNIRRRVMIYLAVIAMMFGVAAGVRWPPQWATTHLLFDYTHGFVKRGFAGELLRFLLGERVTYISLATVSFTTFILWVSQFLARVNAISRTVPAVWLIAAIFFLSPGFIFMVHTIGFLDHVALVVVFVCLLIRVTITGMIARILLCSFVILAHETFFLSFFPIIVFDVLLRSSKINLRVAMIRATLLIGVIAVLTIWIAKATLPPEIEPLFASYTQGRAVDFETRTDAVEVLFRGTGDNMRIMSGEFWSQPIRVAWFFLGALFLFPLPAYLCVMSSRVITDTFGDPFRRRILIASVWIATFAPTALQFVAWDIWRFFAFTHVASVIVLLSTLRSGTGEHTDVAGRVKPGMQMAALAVLCAMTNINLFGEYAVERPPFIDLASNLINVIQGDVPFLQIPTR